MLDMEDLLAPMGDDPLLMALGDDDLALLRPGGSGMTFSLHGSGSGATNTSDGCGRVTKRRRGGQHDGDEVGSWLFCPCGLVVCWAVCGLHGVVVCLCAKLLQVVVQLTIVR
jgi:hypothetical protein